MVGENSVPEEKPITVDSIRNECLDSGGYVLFVGIITNERDRFGNNVISWRYIREKFNYEDTKNAIGKFKEALARDIDGS